MLQSVPTYVELIFVVTTVATLLLFVRVIRSSNKETTRQKSKPILLGLIIWLAIQAALALKNVYNTDPNFFPPKLILLGVLPTVVVIIYLFVSKKGRGFLDSLPLKSLTYLHVVRIAVEVGLFYLFVYKAVPELMTFEGRNFDIISGITAPFIAYFGLAKLKLSRQVILSWNIICLGLLINIVVNALFSAPSPFQEFAFEQPNIAILNFPFSWLPTFIVPIVLFCQLTSIRQLLKPSSFKGNENRGEFKDA